MAETFNSGHLPALFVLLPPCGIRDIKSALKFGSHTIFPAFLTVRDASGPLFGFQVSLVLLERLVSPEGIFDSPRLGSSP